MKWIAKAIVQKTISFLPGSHKINYLFQKHVTKGVYLTQEYFEDRLTHATSHIKSFNEHRGSIEGITSMELGTGWYPVVPITIFLCGAKEIITVDIDRLLTNERLQTTMRMFMEYKTSPLLKSLPLSPSRLQELEKITNESDALTLEELLKRLNIRYLVTDARQLPLENNSIDMVHSNNTFEHVYANVLSDILKEMKRVVKKSHQGVMSHAIDLSDHFAHFDTSITVYNFLKFSDAQWKWIDNSIQPQNRLRMDDYKTIYRNLNIAISEESYREGRIDELKTVKLDKKFSKKSLVGIAISHCHFISKMNE